MGAQPDRETRENFSKTQSSERNWRSWETNPCAPNGSLQSPNHRSRLATSPQVAHLVSVAASVVPVRSSLWDLGCGCVGVSPTVLVEGKGRRNEATLHWPWPEISLPLPPALTGLAPPPKMENTRGTTAAFSSSWLCPVPRRRVWGKEGDFIPWRYLTP
jgi:hypothetical protein